MTVFIIQIVFLIALLITAILCFSFIKKVDPDYKPMLLFCISTFLFETTIFVLPKDSQIIKILINAQYLLGTFLICWQARKWKLLQEKSAFKFVLFFIMAVWLIERFVTRRSSTIDIAWFTVIYSVIIVFLAIELLKRQIIFESGKLMKNPIVLFSMGLLFYYTFSIILDLFMIIGRYSDQGVLKIVWVTTIVLSLVTNFLYLKAVLCTPKIID